MRHRIAGNRLGRNSSLRKATVRDLARAILEHERICTTLAKAKEARRLVDRLITLGKKGSLAHKRRAFSILGSHRMVSDLFNKTAPRFRARPGGYTRIIPLSLRRGDSAQLAYLELTEKSAVVVSPAKSAATSKAKDTGVVPAKKSVKEPAQPERPQKAPEKPGTKEHKKEQTKGGKKMLGGIKKMFRRKTGE